LKKEGKIQKVYRLHQEGVSVKEISEKMNLGERIVRSYLWRMQNPEKHRELVRRYFTKKKQKANDANKAEDKPAEVEKKERKPKKNSQIK
jgi:hypothetical protein